jgi:hypothetical protein
MRRSAVNRAEARVASGSPSDDTVVKERLHRVAPVCFSLACAHTHFHPVWLVFWYTAKAFDEKVHVVAVVPLTPSAVVAAAEKTSTELPCDA